MSLELRILAEVNVLCTSDEAVQWVPLIGNIIPMKLTQQKDATTGACNIHLGADCSDDTSLDLQISLSESKLKKVSECFVRWKDVQSGKAWGLNFLSEEEAFEFMCFCEGIPGDYSSSTASSISHVRKSTSSLNSSSNLKEISKNAKASQDSPRCASENGRTTPQAEAVAKEGSKGLLGVHGNTELWDSGVGEDEVEAQNNPDFNLTEFTYYKEMEIFQTTVNDQSDSRNLNHTDGNHINQTDHSPGGLKKSGWLSTKYILLYGRNGRVEHASNRKWKNYWVILKGCELNLYLQCDEKDVGSIDLHNPSNVMKLDGCLAQAVPEHAKLENVFGVSTQNGDVYYFQGLSQFEVQGWIASIHCAAATQFGGGRDKEHTNWLLSKELEKIQGNIDSESKLKKTAELQLTIVTDSKNKQAFTDQISKSEQNLEKLNLDSYKLRCYMLAIGSPSPNPQDVLACATKQTKQNMSRLGMFSVLTFHSLIFCRETAKADGHLKTTQRLKRSKSTLGYTRLKDALKSSFKITDSLAARSLRERHSPRSFSPKSSRKVEKSGLSEEGVDPSVVSGLSDWRFMGNYVRVELPSRGTTVVPMKDDMTFLDVVSAVARKRHLDADLYFVVFGVERGAQVEYYTPQEQAFIEDQHFNVLKMCKKSEYNIEMSKTNDDCDQYFGLSLKIENNRVIVSRVKDGSESQVRGVLEGDEILSVNNQEITGPENGLKEAVNALLESFISLKLRSMREEVPEQVRITTESIISTLVCPPPPKTSTSEYLDVAELIVPPPEFSGTLGKYETQERPASVVGGVNEEDAASVDILLQSAEEVTFFCRQHESSHDIERQTELSDAEKLRKIIFELLDTEKSYLKDVQTLLKRYLEPLKHESFLPNEEVNSLAENVTQIIEFQDGFCSEIQQLLDYEEDFKNINEIGLFQNVIYGIGEAFLQYADKFKLYSSFCVTHARVIHMFHPGSNIALKEFLDARNPKQQHSSKLESYLIKPIQRILKYPLLLNGMLKFLNNRSDEYRCLNEAMNAIENVAEHINEMQSITEEFLEIFQELASANGSLEVSDVDIDKLLHHKKVIWLNSPETMKANSLRWSPAPLRKTKSELTMRCFVFPKAVILIQLEKRQKKKDKSSRGGSIKFSEEITFKTLIPMSSLVLRDNSWSDQGLFNAWELVDMSRNSGNCDEEDSIYLLSSRDTDERLETVRKIKEAIRRSMIEDSDSLSHRKPSTASVLSTNSIQLGFPAVPGHLRRSFSYQPGRAHSKHMAGKQYSAGDVKTYSASKQKR